MTHPDPRVADVVDRNRAALAAAVGAPPRHIANDPAAYLAWAQQAPWDRPVAPRKPRPAEVPVQARKGREWLPRVVPRRPVTALPAPDRDAVPPPDGPLCDCGALLDPDGTCFVCEPAVSPLAYEPDDDDPGGRS